MLRFIGALSPKRLVVIVVGIRNRSNYFIATKAPQTPFVEYRDRKAIRDNQTTDPLTSQSWRYYFRTA